MLIKLGKAGRQKGRRLTIRGPFRSEQHVSWSPGFWFGFYYLKYFRPGRDSPCSSSLTPDNVSHVHGVLDPKPSPGPLPIYETVAGRLCTFWHSYWQPRRKSNNANRGNVNPLWTRAFGEHTFHTMLTFIFVIVFRISWSLNYHLENCAWFLRRQPVSSLPFAGLPSGSGLVRSCAPPVNHGRTEM